MPVEGYDAARWLRKDPVKRLASLCLGLVLLLLSARADAAEESRIALVVGIGTYAHAPELLNPPRDARAIADRLRDLGFDIDLKLDLDNRALAGALRDFGVRAANADVALVYYAGHGVQVDGSNYLVPSDARLQRVRDLLYEAVPIWLVRDTPRLPTRRSMNGLSRQASSSTMVTGTVDLSLSMIAESGTSLSAAASSAVTSASTGTR